MTTKNITLRVKEKLYDSYREFCKHKGWIPSRQFEILMQGQMEKEGWKIPEEEDNDA